MADAPLIDLFAIVQDQRDRLLAMMVEVLIRYEYDGVPNDSRQTVDAGKALICELSGRTA